MTEPIRTIVKPKVLFEVIEVSETLVSGYIRESKNRTFGISIPKFICPEIACIPGGSFYIQTETVDMIEEQKILDELFKDI